MSRRRAAASSRATGIRTARGGRSAATLSRRRRSSHPLSQGEARHRAGFFCSGTTSYPAGEVTSYPYQAESPTETHWPWRVNVRLDWRKPFIHEGVALEGLSVDGRDLRRSMRRRSHIRLSEKEYEVAVNALRA